MRFKKRRELREVLRKNVRKKRRKHDELYLYSFKKDFTLKLFENIAILPGFSIIILIFL